MSWSIGFTGTKEAAKTAIVLQAESPLNAYAGKPEAGDVQAAVDRALALIDAVDFTGTEYNGVKVNANGSHSVSNSGIIAASFSVNVTSVKLEG